MINRRKILEAGRKKIALEEEIVQSMPPAQTILIIMEMLALSEMGL